MILHATELGAANKIVHLMTQNTDVLVAALWKLPFLGLKPSLIMGTGERQRQILLQPIYDHLRAFKATALFRCHCLPGCDICGHIRGKSKRAVVSIFCTSSVEVTTALAHLGICDMSSDSVVIRCEECLRRLFCTKKNITTTPGKLRWRLFKNQPLKQGIDNIPPTSGTWYQHIFRAHMQAYIWNQHLVFRPEFPGL